MVRYICCGAILTLGFGCDANSSAADRSGTAGTGATESGISGVAGQLSAPAPAGAAAAGVATAGQAGWAAAAGARVGTTGSAMPVAGGVGVSGITGSAGTASSGGQTGSAAPPVTANPSGSCSAPEIRITEIDLGAASVVNEDEANLKPLMLSAIPSGGSRLAWMGADNLVHVTQLGVSDAVAGTAFTLAAHDFSDIYADDKGGVLLLTRDASDTASSTHCGNVNNLCGATASLPTTTACYDMFMVRFDGTAETWAAKLTDTTSARPAYLTSPTDAEDAVYIWWYAHHGRIASDGVNFAGYFGAAISVSQTCVDAASTLKTGVNIHQGDRMKVVGPSGALVTGGFDWGCSHSGYERIVWDPSVKKYVTICKNDAATAGKSGKIAYAPKMSDVILPVELRYSNLGNIVVGGAGGYWTTVSDIQAGQPAASDGLADVHLIHFTKAAADQDILLAADPQLNERAPHLAGYGSARLLAAWESSTATGDLTNRSAGRKLFVQVLDGSTGAAVSPPIPVDVVGNRYQDFRSYPDGSVAYAAPGSSASKVKILRVMPCE